MFSDSIRSQEGRNDSAGRAAAHNKHYPGRYNRAIGRLSRPGLSGTQSARGPLFAETCFFQVKQGNAALLGGARGTNPKGSGRENELAIVAKAEDPSKGGGRKNSRARNIIVHPFGLSLFATWWSLFLLARTLAHRSRRPSPFGETKTTTNAKRSLNLRPTLGNPLVLVFLRVVRPR